LDESAVGNGENHEGHEGHEGHKEQRRNGEPQNQRTPNDEPEKPSATAVLHSAVRHSAVLRFVVLDKWSFMQVGTNT